MENNYIIKEKHPPLEGHVINGITFLKYLGSDKHGHNYWQFRCPYDNKVFSAREDSVKKGTTASCGCLRKEQARNVGKTNKKFNLIFEAFEDDYAKVYLNNCEDFFVIDKEDIPRVEKYCWRALKRESGRIDIVTTINKTTVYLSRYLMEKELATASEGIEVDHLNGDTMDYRKCNLRLATPKENNQNKKSAKQGEIIEVDGKFKIVNFPKEDTSNLWFISESEAEEYLKKLYIKHNISVDFSYRFSQKRAEKFKIFARHGIHFGNTILKEIQALPTKNPHRIFLDRVLSQYKAGDSPMWVIETEIENLLFEYNKDKYNLFGPAENFV